MQNDNEFHSGGDTKPIWNLYQFGLSILCCVSISVLYKIPIDHYFGSGWSMLSVIIFLIIFASPIIYLQLRFGSQYKAGLLVIMDRSLPVGLIFTIGCYLRNFVHVIYTSGLITHYLSYIFFAMFNCDGKLCVGGTYPWSSCHDAWAEGNCMDGVKIIYRNPTAEEKFYENFFLMRTTQIAINENFPTWFEYTSLIIVPHLLTWILLFLLVIGGAKIFGKILYGLVPVPIILYVIVFVYVLSSYADDNNLRSSFLDYFLTRFPNHVPVIATEWDQYAFEPLIWGFLSTFTNLSIGLNLWNGVYPIMGKWIGNGKKRTHLSWIIVVIVFGSFVFIPTLLNVAFLASSFSFRYLRCQVSRSWSFPFTIATHIFTKFATNKALAVAYFFANLCFLLASEGFLIVATMETIIDHFNHWHGSFSAHFNKFYRISCLLVTVLLCGISFSTISRSGYYWIYLMDFYVDRLLCMMMIGQSICLIVIYVFSKRAKLEKKLLKTFFVIYLCIISVLIATSLVWFTVSSGNQQPTKDCHYERLNPNIDPISISYIGLGWFIAACPLLIGVLIGPILILLHSKKRGMGNQCWYYSLRGDDVVVRKEIVDEDECHIIEVGKGSTRNLTSLSRMQYMRDTLQSDPFKKSTLTKSQTESSSPYFNVDKIEAPRLLYDQRQSLRRPLISPDSSMVSSHEHAQIRKTKKSRQFQNVSDV